MIRSSSFVPFVAVALLPWIGSSASAQSVLRSFAGAGPETYLGEVLNEAGDVDGDGVVDLIVGLPFDDQVSQNAGKVILYSGLDGSVLFTFLGSTSNGYFGQGIAAAGDVNGDGRGDVIVGAPYGGGGSLGLARVYSGLDGSVLHSLVGTAVQGRFGGAVCGAGDVNADGRDDFAVGANFADQSGNDNRGRVQVFSGLDASQIYSYYGESVDGLGWAVAPAGDANADGYSDIAMAALVSDGSGNADGEVRIVSGFDGALLHVFASSSDFDWFGYSIAGAGDVDQDGHDDLIVGIPEDRTHFYESGAAWVMSGADGTQLHALYGDTIVDAFGCSVDGAGDVDGDGFVDLLVGAWRDDLGLVNTGAVHLYSGQDYEPLFSIYGDATGDELGIAVTRLGDLDADGRSDFAVGAGHADDGAPNAGTVRIYGIAPAECVKVASFCTALPPPNGERASLSYTGTASLEANGLRLHVRGAAPDQVGMFLFGPPRPLPTLANARLCVSGASASFALQPTDVHGHARLDLDLAALPLGDGKAEGGAAYFQFLFRDGASELSFDVSDVLAVRFCR